MKYIAYFLPQFHKVKENDEWWGAGFTEWTNVKKMRPLFKEHYQPHEPLNDNYYVLTDKKAVEYQTELMHKYNVYGFAYYHYWFEGRLLLEKPVSNLLAWKDIDQKFFFFWANHSWIKSVDGVKSFLINQTYSGEQDWRAHFEYFLPFFKDERYIKMDGKPVVAIYKPEDIPNFDDMIGLWNQLAKRSGFNGVYIIQSINGYDQYGLKTNADADMLRQPNLGGWDLGRWYNRFVKRPKLQKYVPIFYPFKIKYSKVVDNVIKTSQAYRSDRKVFYCVHTGWDNTSRHGRRGYVHTDVNPVDFKRSVRALSALAEPDDFLFINAWNEWAEGMHLEPDKKNGLSFLEVLRDE